MAVFARDERGLLQLKTIAKVKNINNPSSFIGLFQQAYYNGGSGDSGGPVSSKTKVSSDPKTSKGLGEKRHVIIAIYTNGRKSMSTYKCKAYGTKVSMGIVSWIKKLESMDLNAGKRMPYLIQILKNIDKNRK